MYRLAMVEDNSAHRALVHDLLDEHYLVDDYADGPRALASLKLVPPDLVLLDISLPGMDGREVLARLRGDPVTASVPVIALTAHAKPGLRTQLLAAGFNDCLAKPITDAGPLCAAIVRALAAARVAVSAAAELSWGR